MTAPILTFFNNNGGVGKTSLVYHSMRILSSFWQAMQMTAHTSAAEIILVDIGANLGAINRSALIAADFVVIPLGADLFSLQGLKNLGPTLLSWRKAWKKRIENWQNSPTSNQHEGFRLPTAEMLPIGYLCQQHSVRLDRPIKAYERWIKRIPTVYREYVLNEPPDFEIENPSLDPYCLATIKHFRSLIPLGQESRKPIFNLTVADGAFGSHGEAVRGAKKDFTELAQKIAQKIGITLALFDIKN